MIHSQKTKYKLLSAEFDKKTGVSTVVIDTDYGKFVGTAKLHPDDKEFASNYTGCYLAELRANRKYIKAQKENIETQYKILTILYKDMLNHKDCNVKSMEMRNLRRFIYLLQKEIFLLKQTEERIEQALKRKDSFMDKFKEIILLKRKKNK